MKLFVISAMLISLALSARLDNTYLPPGSTRSFGGNSQSATSFGSGENSVYSSARFSGANSRSYSNGPQFRILRFNNDNAGDGNYRFEYETENQIKQQEVGEQKILGNEQTNSVRGSYSYITPEGQRVSVNYIADENGFRAEGDHLPTQPANQPSFSLGSGETNLNSGTYPSGSSEPFEGVEISAARSANRQYLPPRANQAGY